MNYQCDFISEYIDKKDDAEIDLKEIFFLMLKNLKYIIASALICALIAFGYTKVFVTEMYSSTTTAYVLNRSSTSRLEETSLTYSDLQSGTQLVADYIQLIQSRTVANNVIQDLKLNMKISQLLSIVDVSATDETRLLKITVTHPNPVMARKIANSVRENAAEHINTVMDTEGIAVSDEANLPYRPSSPNTKKNTVLGFLLGAIIVMVIVVVRYILDDRIKGDRDITKYLNISVLGVIPKVEMDKPELKRKKVSA